MYFISLDFILHLVLGYSLFKVLLYFIVYSTYVVLYKWYPHSCKLVYKPHEYWFDVSTINHRIQTLIRQLNAIERGGNPVCSQQTSLHHIVRTLMFTLCDTYILYTSILYTYILCTYFMSISNYIISNYIISYYIISFHIIY